MCGQKYILIGGAPTTGKTTIAKKLTKAVFLIDLDEDRMRKVVYERGLYDRADKYSDDVKEKEVEWAMLFTHRLKREALKCGFPCVDVTKTNTDLAAVIEAIESQS